MYFVKYVRVIAMKPSRFTERDAIDTIPVELTIRVLKGILNIDFEKKRRIDLLNCGY